MKIRWHLHRRQSGLYVIMRRESSQCKMNQHSTFILRTKEMLLEESHLLFWVLLPYMSDRYNISIGSIE